MVYRYTRTYGHFRIPLLNVPPSPGSALNRPSILHTSFPPRNPIARFHVDDVQALYIKASPMPLMRYLRLGYCDSF